MKQALVIMAALSVAVFAATSCTDRQPTVTAGGTVFDISPEILESRPDTLVDIGIVREGEVIQYDARLRNTGSEPLVIKSVDTSCGCTSVEYEKKPIAPGEEGDFSFRIDSRGMWGMQMKLIEVNTSASHNGYKVKVQMEVENDEIFN